MGCITMFKQKLYVISCSKQNENTITRASTFQPKYSIGHVDVRNNIMMFEFREYLYELCHVRTYLWTMY